jgi:PAS domain S-box-containing protein
MNRLDEIPRPPGSPALWLNEPFRLCVETLLDCFGVFTSLRDADGRICDFRIDYLNEAACRNNGRTLEEQVGRRLVELMPVHIETGLFDAYVDMVERGVPFERVMQLVPGDGRLPGRWFDIRAARLGDGFVAAWRDVSARVHDAEAMQFNEALFRRLADSNVIGIGVGRSDGAVVYVNDEMLRMMGYTRADYEQGRVNWAASLTPASRADAQHRADRLYRDGVSFGYEREFRRPDGGLTPFVGGAAMLPDGVTHVSFAMDLTGQRRREAALRESDARLRLAMQVAGTGIWEWNLDTDAVTWSRECHEITGVAPQDFAGTATAFHSMVHDDDRDGVEARVRAAIAAREPYSSEFRIVRPDGEVRWVANRGQAFFGADGSAQRVLGTLTDITERQRVAAELAHSAERLRIAKEAAGLGIHDFDPVTGRIDWDERVRELWGVAPDAPITLDVFYAGVHPDDHAQVQAAVRHALDPSGDGRYYNEYRVVHRIDRQTRWVAATGQASFADGHATRLVGTVQDVSALKHADAALREADRRKDEFLATLAHELRNPLAPIRQAAQVARMPQATPAQVRWSHEVIARQADRMALLLDDLMDISRITQGRIVLDRVPVTLRAVVDAAVETVTPLTTARHHTLEIDVPDAPIAVEGDALRLSQILSNLLANAAKYTAPGGRIRIEARRDGADACIAVVDNGVGIAPDKIESMFRMFAQAPAVAAHRDGGLGIGLALARALAELHGGVLIASSDGLGHGAKFVLRLPALDASAAAPAPPAPPLVPSGVRRRVLVVDDNVDAAESLAALLRLLGHDVHTAHNGHAGLALARGARPEVALVDLGMPGMDGFRLARELRALPDGERTLLVAVTGWGLPDDRARTAAAGFNWHLTKPVDPATLAAVLA